LPITQTHSYRVEAPLHHAKSGEVTLNIEDKTTLQIDLDPAYGFLKVNTTPESGAEIEINGKLQTQTTPFTSDKLEMGKYTVQAFKPMYKSEPQRVDVREGKTTEITIELIPTFVTADLNCQDKEIEIYIDGEFKAKGSFKGRLEEGTHQFEFKKKSHRTIKRTINALSGQTLTENIEELKKDSAIKHSEYTKKLSKANQLVERYKKMANDSVIRYIDSQAIRLGVTSNEIKNRLSEGFSFDDIDMVCEELQAYKLNISKLPFDISKTKNVRMKVTESKEPIKPANRFSDEIDDQLKSLAGL
jgi:hypothetical protein